MSDVKFKVGDAVIRTAPVGPGVVEATGLTQHQVYTVSAVCSESIALMEAKRLSNGADFYFTADYFEMYLPADPTDDPWTLAVALRLRKEAQAAVARYNAYLGKQPKPLACMQIIE